MGFFDRLFGKKAKLKTPSAVREAPRAARAVDPNVRTAEIARLEARIAEIAQLEDQRVLAELAENDKSAEVREAALGKLVEQPLLARIACESQDQRTARAALEKLKDQSLIADVAVHEKQSRNVTCDAVRALTEPRMLARVVMEVKDSSLIGKAVERIHDEALLLELLSKVRSQMGPYMIVDKGCFSDENLILIARTYPAVRRKAIERIKDTKALAEFALTSENASDRLSAVERTGDQAILIDIARNDKDLAVRVAATSRLTDADLAQAMSADILRIVNRELGDRAWPSAWRSLKNGPRLISILRSASTRSSDCPYYDSAVCMVRVTVRRDTSSGPEECTWADRPYRECHVWRTFPLLNK